MMRRMLADAERIPWAGSRAERVGSAESLCSVPSYSIFVNVSTFVQ